MDKSEFMDSMPRRLEEVILRQGVSTKYWDPWKQKTMEMKVIFSYSIFCIFYVFFYMTGQFLGC
jgi:hypothetical protein